MYNLLSSGEFSPFLEIKIIFDENVKEIQAFDIDHFHDELYLFAKNYFTQIGVEAMDFYFKTCYSSSFDYYKNHPFHLECGFLQRDMELLNNNIVFHEKLK